MLARKTKAPVWTKPCLGLYFYCSHMDGTKPPTAAEEMLVCYVAVAELSTDWGLDSACSRGRKAGDACTPSILGQVLREALIKLLDERSGHGAGEDRS